MALTSCKHSDKRMGRFYMTLMEAKKESLSRWKSTHSLAFVGLRTGMILDGGEYITLTNSHATPTGGFSLNYRIDKDSASEMTIGSAVPITEDGYFLTARHCVDDGSDTLATLVRGENSVELVKTGYRVVWATDQKEDLDLALIHADVRPYKPFEFANQESLNKGLILGATGWSALTKGDSNPLAGMAVGNLESFQHLKTKKLEGKWMRVRHTVPLHPGDSGGPIVNESGQLVGINSEVRISFSEQVRSLFKKEANRRPARGYIAIGAYPDLERIEAYIEADRESKESLDTR